MHTHYACMQTGTGFRRCVYICKFVCMLARVPREQQRERERESICVCIEDDSKLSVLAARNSGHCSCDACISVHVRVMHVSSYDHEQKLM
jgi:hypothetical protein